jgi:selenocysteine lyase/cysteine desulfurase
MTDEALGNLLSDESLRRDAFPVCRDRVFMAHAGVTALPRTVADAMVGHVRQASENHQEFGEVMGVISETRRLAAEMIGAHPDEIALLGPTSLGLSLVALGLPWEAGDEMVCYGDDYPANVYPWLDLERKGVVVRRLRAGGAGELTPEVVGAALTPRTRLVALASANFLSGYRLDIAGIGALLRSRGVLFCLDGIQTLGAFPTTVERVDFLSADAHKWLLGPLAIGVVFVRKEHFERLRPALVGAWNVESPQFVARDTIRFVETARRYEPGVLNVAGIYGMRAAMKLLLEVGIDRIAGRIVAIKRHLVESLSPAGFEFLGPTEGPSVTGITAFRHPRVASEKLFAALESNRVSGSLRHDRSGVAYIRLSPHFYNTIDETDRVVKLLSGGVSP